jgi:hypothetical protein
VRIEENGSARPFAYADPRSLSQAWYDALFQSPRQKPPHANARSPQTAQPDERAAAPSERLARAAVTARGDVPVRIRPADAPRVQPGGVREEDETALSLLTRRENPAPSRARSPLARTDVEVGAGESPVRLLLAARGSHVEVVAVCGCAAGERTAEALARARLALAARGIALEPTIRERSQQ